MKLTTEPEKLLAKIEERGGLKVQDANSCNVPLSIVYLKKGNRWEDSFYFWKDEKE